MIQQMLQPGQNQKHIMLPDPVASSLTTPIPSRSTTPAQKFSLPPIRELLKDTQSRYNNEPQPSHRQLHPYPQPQPQPQPQPFLHPIQQTQVQSQYITHPPFPPVASQYYQQTPQHAPSQYAVNPSSPLVVSAPGSQVHSPIGYDASMGPASRPHMSQQQHIQHQQQISAFEQHRYHQIEFDNRVRVHDAEIMSKNMGSHTAVNGGRKKRQNLPRQTTLILLSWLSDHLDRPYPNSREKYDLLMKTRLTIQQLDNWFINARRRKIAILRKLKENDQSIALSL
ncbi:CUP9 [Cyberlindnera jadinii]|uniref:CUP9 protein n=2 Tax=Cyberlindnera jadinii (strain ATCC 18201 / CBS 1600 / BCRC 20928 / JCM 3617 / NBRC 0987 / NRRL Y-1542) TaxID=983966 RepID=A0A0H5C017_CYBJN|nr:CUP9 [Cyberlindnera jadinii]